jgi:predicted nucleic acid-binding protein
MGCWLLVVTPAPIASGRYACCFAAALAQARKASLVTSDKNFERVGIALKFVWI